MIFDISQEILSSKVYPGDPVPEKKVMSRMDEGHFIILLLFPCAHIMGPM